jgi:hypothetical protein
MTPTDIVWRIARRNRSTLRHATRHGHALCHAMPAGGQWSPDDPTQPTCPRCTTRTTPTPDPPTEEPT